MKTKFIILLTILSGLIYCSNAFGWTQRYTISYPTDSTLKIMGVYNNAMDSGVGTDWSTSKKYKKLVFEGTMNASNFFMFTRRDIVTINPKASGYYNITTTNKLYYYTDIDSIYLKIIDLTNVKITTYKGHLSGQSQGVFGDYGVFCRGLYNYDYNHFSVANRLSSYTIVDFFAGQYTALQKIILPKTITSISPYFLKHTYSNKRKHFVDTIMVTNKDSVIKITYDSVMGKMTDSIKSWQAFFNAGTFIKGYYKTYYTDSVVAFVPNNLLAKYKSAYLWNTLKIVGYTTDTTNDASLASITPSIGTLNETVSKTRHKYTITVPFSTTINDVAIPVTIIPTNTYNAIVTQKYGTSLKYTGKGTPLCDSLFVKVLASDRVTYANDTIIFIIGKASNDATLKSLTSNIGILSPTFSPSVLSYTLTLPKGTTKIPVITAILNDSNASISIDSTYALLSGVNYIYVGVFAEDGKTSNQYFIYLKWATSDIQQVTSDETKPKIYPTLVTNTLNISGINQGNVIIYDLNGNAILRKEVQPQIDVSDLPKGIYLVSINNLCIGKIVK